MKRLFSIAAELFWGLVDLLRGQCPYDAPGCTGRECEDCDIDSKTGGWG